VAEGAEDESTLARLAAMSCEVAQGHHICRPAISVHFVVPDGLVQHQAQAAVAGDDGHAPPYGTP
jgi:EAL domain-containing protein (putative c-di-GMP-specific phosphodiesterase class I)